MTGGIEKLLYERQPRIPSQECDKAVKEDNDNPGYFNPRIPSQECDGLPAGRPFVLMHFNPRIPSQECDIFVRWR